MSCNHCDPNGFNSKACNFCGIHGDKVYISICIRLNEVETYPYTETDMCRKCWDEIGIDGALQHNIGIQESMSTTAS